MRDSRSRRSSTSILGSSPTAVADVEEWQGTRPGTVFGDFRKVLDDKDIDALIVGTPDHWHAIPTVFACQAGKHVYVEKPDGHNIREGRLMVAAARKYDRVVQMGVQSRSGAHFAEAIDYLRGGAIGRALYARAWESAKQGSIGRPADAPVPEGVDYDTWLGPAPKRPFNPMRFHGNWRWFFDYGTGDLGNDGVHRLDMARRGLEAALMARGGEPLGMPTTASATGGKRYFDDMQEFPDTQFVTLDYADQKATVLYEMRVWAPYKLDDEPEGAAVFGDAGYVVIGNSRWRAFDPGGKVVAQGSSPNSQHEKAHRQRLPRVHPVGRPAELRHRDRPRLQRHVPPRQHRLARGTDPQVRRGDRDHPRRSRGERPEGTDLPPPLGARGSGLTDGLPRHRQGAADPVTSPRGRHDRHRAPDGGARPSRFHQRPCGLGSRAAGFALQASPASLYSRLLFAQTNVKYKTWTFDVLGTPRKGRRRCGQVPGRRGISPRRGRGASWAGPCSAWSGCGCGRPLYRAWADREVYGIEGERMFDWRWSLPGRPVEADPRFEDARPVRSRPRADPPG